MIIIIIITLFILLTLGFLYWNYFTLFTLSKVKKSDLSKYIKAFYYRGSDNSFMIIKRHSHKQFLQFSKYVESKGIVHLILGFPLANWSKQYYEKIKSILNDIGVSYTIQPIRNENSLEFLDANFGKNIDIITNFINIVFETVFEIKDETLYKFKFSSISPHDEKIGF
jgi:hypothetical protein